MNSERHSIALDSVGNADRFAAAVLVLEDAITAQAFPGCAYGILAEGEVVFEGARGRFTYEETAPVVEVSTVFDVASLTKVVATTAAAMLLVQRGQLDVDTRLAEMLPGFVLGRAPGDEAYKVTLRHLLAHNSGLPGYVEFFRKATTPEALVQACLTLPLDAEPGTRSEYSDPGFILLGKAIEALIDTDLATWTSREIFGPLEMLATRFRPAQEMHAAVPPTEEDTTFRRRRIQGEVQDENAWVLNGVSGHAGIFSNVPDLLRFARAILQSANTSGGQTRTSLFDRTVLEMFSQPQPPSGNSFAIGWDTPSQPSSSGRYFSPHSIGHLGYSGCSLWIDLDAAIAIVLLTNRTWPDRKSQLIRTVRPAFHDAVRDALMKTISV
jgi:serine-type D-Ala-D-Ala carboxypeptidase